MRRAFVKIRRARVVSSMAVALGLLIGLAVPADAQDGQWDPTLPPTISAGAPGDPVAIANQSLQATASATQSTLDLGRQFLGGLGINLGGSSSTSTSTGKIPRVYGRQAAEYAIRRGSSPGAANRPNGSRCPRGTPLGYAPSVM